MIKNFNELCKEKGRPSLVALGLLRTGRARLEKTQWVSPVTVSRNEMPLGTIPVEVVRVIHWPWCGGLLHERRQLFQRCGSEAPPLDEHDHPFDSRTAGWGRKDVAVRPIRLLTQPLAAQERLAHPQKGTDRVKPGHGNLQFGWFGFSSRGRTLLATTLKKITNIVLRAVASETSECQCTI